MIFERRTDGSVYQEFEPGPELDDDIQCIWTMSTSDLETVHRVVPDGGMNLLFEWTRRGYQCRLVGCLTGPLMKQYRLATDVLAVRFRPGGANDLFSEPSNRFTGRVLDTSTFWFHSQRLANILNRAKTSDHAVDSLTKYLMHQRANKKPQSVTLGKQLIQRIVADPNAFDMAQFSKDYGRSRQHITRSVKSACGLSPKRLARILRLKQLMREASHVNADWASLAVKYGFYDQAHLIHECNEFNGTTPAKLIAERSGHI